MAFESGDVIWVEFPGAVKNKRRPAAVVSSKGYHQSRPDVILGLLTSQIAKANAPTDYVLTDWGMAGLRVQTAFRAYLATVSQHDVSSGIGRLSDADWKAVKDCLFRALG